MFGFLETRVLGRWGSMGRLILSTSQLIRVDADFASSTVPVNWTAYIMSVTDIVAGLVLQENIHYWGEI